MSDNNNQILKSLLEVVNTKGQIADFVEAFKYAVETLNKMKAATGAELSQLRITFDQAIKNLQTTNLTDFTDIKGQLIGQINEKLDAALQEQESGMNFIRDKIQKIKEGTDGVPGLPGKDADEQAIIQAVLAQIPAVTMPDMYDDAELQAKIDEHAKAIEELKAKGTSSTPGWGAHPLNIYQSGTIKAETARHINFTGATVTQSPDGVTTVAISAGGVNSIYGEDLTPQGPGTSYTLAHTPTVGTVRLYRGGSYQQAGVGKDYTISGAVITLSTTTQTGELLLVDYNY